MIDVGEGENEVCLRNAADKLLVRRFAHHGQALAIVRGEDLEGVTERRTGSDNGELAMEKILGDDNLRELRGVQVILDVMQRDGAEEVSVIGDVKIIEPVRDEFFADLREMRDR